MIIAFMGNDGSGKTTIGHHIVDLMKKVYFFKDIEYREEFTYFILKFPLQIFGRNVEKKRKEFLLGKQNKIFKIWTYLVWFDQLIAFIYYKIFKCHKILILDRYAYDFLMSWIYLSYSNSIIYWLYKFFPKSDVAIIFWCRPQVAYERKKSTHSYALSFYEKQTGEYLSFANEAGIKTINTEGDINDTIGEVSSYINSKVLKSLRIEDRFLILLSIQNSHEQHKAEFDKFKFSVNSLNWKYLIQTSIKCNVENVFLNNVINFYSGHLNNEIMTNVTEVLKKSNYHIEMFLKTMEILKKELKKQNIEYVIFKTIAPFDYGFTDIDVLVRKRDFAKVQKICEGIYTEKITSNIHKAITFKKESLLPIDLHYEISWSGIKIFGEEILKRKRKINYKGLELFIPNKDDEIKILIAHDIYQHHYTTLGSFYWIQLLLLEKIHISPGKPVIWHSIFSLPKVQNKEQLKDTIFYFYRRIRFLVNKKLPYNEVWV